MDIRQRLTKNGMIRLGRRKEQPDLMGIRQRLTKNGIKIKHGRYKGCYITGIGPTTVDGTKCCLWYTPGARHLVHPPPDVQTAINAYFNGDWKNSITFTKYIRSILL